MIEFAWPYIFLLLPLPWLLYKSLPAVQLNEQAALCVPDLQDFQCLRHSSSLPRSNFKLYFALLIWAALLTSAARPQWIGKPIEIPQSGRDLMLAVDLSGSMQMKDFEMNGTVMDRLTALKLIASDFIDRRRGDRIGLILFGSNAYLQTPLTFDTSTVRQLLVESEVGLAGNETAIGDAIGLAVKQLKGSAQKSRVLILMTDGNNNAGELSPEKAAEIASNAHLKIYTVAIGANEMMVQTLFGRKAVNPSANLDEKTLKAVAEKTGGHYFRAYNTQELVKIYRHIDELEKVEHTAQLYRPTDEMYGWPLAFALIGIAVLMTTELFKRGWQ